MISGVAISTGGSDLPTSSSNGLFGGGAGGGVSVQPLAFLVIKDGKVDLLQINDSKTTADRIVTMMPDMVDKVSGLFSKGKSDKKQDGSKEEAPDIGTTEINIDL